MRNRLLTLIGLGILTSVSCTKVMHPAKTDVQVYQMEAGITSTEDSSVYLLIDPYKSALDAEMNAVVGKCTSRLEKARPESTLGNWMADALYAKASVHFEIPIDFAVQNYGGIRIPYLAAGDIRKGTIYELMPFENRMVVLQVSGTVLKQFFDHLAALGGWPISKAVRFEIEDEKAKNIQINGQTLVLNNSYTFVLPDYIANGGDNCSFLSVYENRIDSEKLIREALLEYLTKNPIIEGAIEGRIKKTN